MSRARARHQDEDGLRPTARMIVEARPADAQQKTEETWQRARVGRSLAQ